MEAQLILRGDALRWAARSGAFLAALVPLAVGLFLAAFLVPEPVARTLYEAAFSIVPVAVRGVWNGGPLPAASEVWSVALWVPAAILFGRVTRGASTRTSIAVAAVLMAGVILAMRLALAALGYTVVVDAV